MGVVNLHGPIEHEPRRLRLPHDVPDPARDRVFGTETADEWRTRLHVDNLAALMAPLEGIELGAYDRRILDWLAGWDIPTIGTIASLVHRARCADLACTDDVGGGS